MTEKDPLFGFPGTDDSLTVADEILESVDAQPPLSSPIAPAPEQSEPASPHPPRNGGAFSASRPPSAPVTPPVDPTPKPPSEAVQGLGVAPPNPVLQTSAGASAMPSGAVMAQGGMPFTDTDAAFAKAALLEQQVGSHFAVKAVEGGFVVIPVATTTAASSGSVDQAVSNSGSPGSFPSLYDIPIDELTEEHFPEGHPVRKRGIKAFRALYKPNKKHRSSYISQFPLLLFGALCGLVACFPVYVITLLFDSNALADITTAIPEDVFVQAFRWVFVAGAVMCFGKVIYIRLDRRFTVADKYAKQELGILRRDNTRVYYMNVRTTDLEQSLLGLLFNYGTVELSTAGSDGAEIVFRDITNPELMQAVIEHKTVIAKRAGDVFQID